MGCDNIDCLLCSPNPIEASKKGINFGTEKCRIEFEMKEHI